jgi:hypothetical protein
VLESDLPPLYEGLFQGRLQEVALFVILKYY